VPRKPRDQPGTFGCLEQFRSADQDLLRMVPARQCLGAEQCAVGRPELAW
jgi:hypothetical protein